MGIFGGSRVKKSKLFRISRPYGYNPDDVENYVAKSNETIRTLKDINQSQNYQISQKDAEIKHLKKELRTMYMEMSIMEVPSMDDAQESMILNNFRDQNEPPSKNIKIADDAAFDESDIESIVEDKNVKEVKFNMNDIVD